MLYPAQITQEDDAFLIKFKDVPEALSQAFSWEEVLEMAQDVLKTAMEFYIEDDKKLPIPSKPSPNDLMIFYKIT